MARNELEEKVWKLFEEGLTDNEILDKIVTEEEEELTYMDLRIQRADFEAEHPETVEQPEAPEEEEEEEEEEKGTDIIEFDAVKKPGAILSGKANLPSGAKIEWTFDQAGRIAVAPLDETQQPTQTDMEIFQEEFRKELERRGGML